MNKEMTIFDPMQLVPQGFKLQAIDITMPKLNIVATEVVGKKKELDEYVHIFLETFPEDVYGTTNLGDALFVGSGFVVGDDDLIWGEEFDKNDVYRLYLIRKFIYGQK